MSDRFFRVRLRVHWADTDAAGVAWFGNFFRFFEEAEDELFRALGRTRVELTQALGILMPRVNATARFFSPARAEEVLEVGITVDQMSARRIAYQFEIREEKAGRIVAEGGYEVACVRQESFAPMAFPPEVARLVEGFGDLVQRQQASRRGPGWA